MKISLTEHYKIIEPAKKPVLTIVRQIYQFRSILFTLAKRDVKAKYTQTVLGLLWSVIQPLTGLLIFTIFFDKLIKVDTNNIPYPLFAFSGMVAWYFYTFIVNQGGTSLVDSQYLLKKFYFPRLILPLSKVLVGLVDFGISVILLIILMIILGGMPSFLILLFPVFLLLAVLTGLSIAIWLSALTIRYRDLQHIIPYLINFSIWLTPVFYPSTLVPESYHFILYLNPMAGIIAGFRWCLLGDLIPSINYLWGILPVIFIFISGIYYFIKIEREIVDII
ncbi:ABC transporter permease [Candidatus Woesearchaeota archaeon]|jgi:lipopolysaccharide transport system permease protein|nr:ABC transporter permease [Candidatus Woesearchaeota archaeon]